MMQVPGGGDEIHLAAQHGAVLSKSGIPLPSLGCSLSYLERAAPSLPRPHDHPSHSRLHLLDREWLLENQDPGAAAHDRVNGAGIGRDHRYRKLRAVFMQHLYHVEAM